MEKKKKEEAGDKFSCFKLLPLELAMCLTGVLKIQLSRSSQTHMHKVACMGDCKSEAFLYILTAYYVWVCMGVDIINIGVNDIFSLIPLTAGLNPCLEIMGLRKMIYCFTNIEQYTPQLFWGGTSNISLRLCIYPIILLIKYRDKFNF